MTAAPEDFWSRWSRIVAGAEALRDALQGERREMPTVARGQHVIDRRTGDTWTASEWTRDRCLRVHRLTSSATGNSKRVEHRIPWRDVAAAGRQPASRKVRR